MFTLVSMNFIIIIINGCSCMLSYMTQKTECVLKVMKLWFDLGEAISSSSFKKESAERSPLESTA